MDIILSSAYVVTCIYDRKLRATETKFFHLVSNHPDAVPRMKIMKLILFALLGEWCVCLTVMFELNACYVITVFTFLLSLNIYFE